MILGWGRAGILAFFFFSGLTGFFVVGLVCKRDRMKVKVNRFGGGENQRGIGQGKRI